MTEPTSTADYRKYPKGPNFGLIVILFVATIAVVGLCVYLVLRTEGRKMIPKAPDNHPTSYVLPRDHPLHSLRSVDC